jgi:hypothetical protein
MYATARTNTDDDTIDFVNPYLSPLRQWVCRQLAIAVPNTQYVIASNDAKTQEFFKVWTGYTQKDLEKIWEDQGFKRTNKNGRVYTRDGGGAVTTSCEAFIGKVVNKIKGAGFAKGMPPGRKPFRTLDIAGLGPFGKGAATTPGWNWYWLKSGDKHPRPGDIFLAGTRVAPDRWSYAHVGFVTLWVDGPNPTWETVEAGQGGPGAGYDAIKRKGPRPLNPVDPKNPSKVLMGWVDIDVYFGVEGE